MLTPREWIFLGVAAVAFIACVAMLLHCQQVEAAPSRTYYVNDVLRIQAESTLNIQFRSGDEWYTAGRVQQGTP